MLHTVGARNNMFALRYRQKGGKKTHSCARRLDINHRWHILQGVQHYLSIVAVGQVARHNISMRQGMNNQCSVTNAL